jgi:excisionase family DNA binding protein
MNADNRFMTIKEAAAILRIQPPTAYEWVRYGKIPSIRANGRIRIPVDEFNKAFDIDQSQTIIVPDPAEYARLARVASLQLQKKAIEMELEMLQG